MALYQLSNVCYRYNGKPVLAIDNWAVAQNSITGLCGPNGSGKTTLLRLLGLIEAPSRGTIMFQDQKTDPYARRIRDRVALLPQESYLLKRSVYQNVAYGLRIRKQRKDESRRVAKALLWVGLDADQFADRPWFALSGGEARRVALAARLVLRPEVLLLDEPTSSVDAASAQLIKEAAIKAHQQWGTSLIISSHDLQWLQEICNDLVYLFFGRILGKGRKTVIFGPWHKAGQGRARRVLSDGQAVEVSNVPENLHGAAAVLDPAELSIHLSKTEVPADKSRLEGRLTRLDLEQRTGRIQASVYVGQIEFCLYLDAKTLSHQNLQPGSRVWLAYRSEQIQWQLQSMES
jgi:tungstate transport system ATP-binding protein